MNGCTICRGRGHQKNRCQVVKPYGKRLTASIYSEFMDSVPKLSVAVGMTDPVIPCEATGLRITGQVKGGLFTCELILHTLEIREGAVYSVTHETIDKWSNCGKSSNNKSSKSH